MLGALFYPKGTKDKPIPFESLFIPYIYKEIYFDGVYIDVLNQRKDLTIVDVGSNIGITVQHFKDYAKTVYAIEPSPEHFEALKKNIEYNQWTNVVPLQYALADKDGEMEFTQNDKNRTMNTLMVGEDEGYNIHKIKDPRVGDMRFIAEGYDNRITVKTKRIDTFFKENNIETVDFMKFDVEGAEDLILRSEGFKNVCRKIKSLEVEFHFPTWPELADYIVSLGYTARRFRTDAIILLFTR